jgi:peptidyl-prolyl cis-trans isomerase D
MLERMRDFSKSWIMKGLLGLVALSFVAYFGSAPFQKAKKERLMTAVKVNGEKVSTVEYNRMYEQLRNQVKERQGFDLDEDQQRQVAEQALNGLIDQTLQKQWCQKVGLQVTDEEVSREITQFLARYARGAQITPLEYQKQLYRLGFPSAPVFEEAVRQQLLSDKVSRILLTNVQLSDSELQDTFMRSRRRAKALVVGFRPDDLKDRIQPERGSLETYYEENKEDYLQPDRVQVDYIEILPSSQEANVSVIDKLLEQYFQENQDRYQIPAKASADFVFFDPKRFGSDVAPSEEEIKEYYEQNPRQFEQAQRVKVRYIPIPLWSPDAENAPTERVLQAAYRQREDDYVQIETSQIFLPVASDAKDLEDALVLKEAERIRQEIEQGLDFAEAARRYSKDASASRGGSLGFLRRKQLPPVLDEALAGLGIGQVSKPIRGSSGYHLLKVHGKHVPPLDEIRTEVLRKYGEEQLNKIREALKNSSFPESQYSGLNVYRTDFFERNQSIDERIGSDYMAFGSIAFRLKDGEMSNVVYGSRNLYLLYREATEEPRPKTIEEARPDVIKQIQAAQADALARQKAEEALARLRSASDDFETVAAEYGLQVQDAGYFTYQDPPVGMGQSAYGFISAAYDLKPGDYSEVVLLESGPYLLRGKAGQPARIPQLSEVREQVERDFRKERSVDLAQDLAYEYLRQIEEQGLSLRKLAALDGSIQVKDSGMFAKDEPIPNLSDANEAFHKAAFSLDAIGAISDVLKLQSASSKEIQGFYLLELRDRAPSHIPPLSEIRAQVQEDYVYLKASEMALEKARAFEEKLRAAIAESATAAFDLRAFAQAEGLDPVETPMFGEMGYIPGIPGTEDSPAFSRTALALEPGQCSGLIEVNRKLDPQSSEQKAKWRVSGYYFLQVEEKQEADIEQFEQDRDALKEQLLDMRRRQSYIGWLEELRRNATIERNEEFLASRFQAQVSEEESGSEEIPSATS